jgi:hypothetical protein
MISSFLEIRPESSRRGLRQRVQAIELCPNPEPVEGEFANYVWKALKSSGSQA